MTYNKPQLLGYSAMTAIQSNHKNGINTELDSEKTQPAYEADE